MGSSSWRRRSVQGADDVSRQSERSTIVLESIENAEANRCVDLFLRSDGSFGFEEFRRDAEDAGAWTRIGFHSHRRYASKKEALAAAATIIAWLRP